MSQTKISGNGIGFGTLLFTVFLVLRLTDHIDWAWYWIAAPIWVPLSLALVLYTFAAIILKLVED